MSRKKKPADPAAEHGWRKRMLRALARLAGRDPAALVARDLSDGRFEVRSANAVAQYEREGWLSRLSRHLYGGYFDPPRVPVRVPVTQRDRRRP